MTRIGHQVGRLGPGAARDAAVLSGLLGLPGMLSMRDVGTRRGAAGESIGRERGRGVAAWLGRAEVSALRWVIVEAAARLAEEESGPSG